MAVAIGLQVEIISKSGHGSIAISIAIPIPTQPVDLSAALCGNGTSARSTRIFVYNTSVGG